MSLKVDGFEWMFKTSGGADGYLVRYTLCPTDPALASRGFCEPWLIPEPVMPNQNENDRDTLNAAADSAWTDFTAGTTDWPAFKAAIESACKTRHGIA